MGWQPRTRGIAIADRYRLVAAPGPGRLADGVDGDAPSADAAVRIALVPASAAEAANWAEAWRTAASGSRALPVLLDTVIEGDVAWAVLEAEPQAVSGRLGPDLRRAVEGLGGALAAAGLEVEAVGADMLARDGAGELVLEGVVPLAHRPRTPREGARLLAGLMPFGAEEIAWEPDVEIRSQSVPRARQRGRRRIVVGATLIALAAAVVLLVLPGVQARSGQATAPGAVLTLAAPTPAPPAVVTVTVVESVAGEPETVVITQTVALEAPEPVGPTAEPVVPAAPLAAAVPTLPAMQAPALGGSAVPVLPAVDVPDVPVLAAPGGG